MKKGFATAFCGILTMAILLGGCAKQADQLQFYTNNSKTAESPTVGGFYEKSESSSLYYDSADTAFAEDVADDDVFYDGRKIIYNSSYNIQTDKFDNSNEKLKELCRKYNAYFESSEVYGTKEKANRHGVYQIRVPSDKYASFNSEAGSIGVIVRSSENNRDITEQYFDTEARLASAKLREERLLAILETADTLDNILLLEAELADVRYEIESLSGSIRKYDSLISYSTVNVNIEEAVEPVEIKAVPKTFSEKALQSISNGFEDFGRFWQNVAIFLLYNLPSVIIFALIITIICVIIRKNIRKSRKAKENENNRS